MSEKFLLPKVDAKTLVEGQRLSAMTRDAAGLTLREFHGTYIGPDATNPNLIRMLVDGQAEPWDVFIPELFDSPSFHELLAARSRFRPGNIGYTMTKKAIVKCRVIERVFCIHESTRIVTIGYVVDGRGIPVPGYKLLQREEMLARLKATNF